MSIQQREESKAGVTVSIQIATGEKCVFSRKTDASLMTKKTRMQKTKDSSHLLPNTEMHLDVQRK